MNQHLIDFAVLDRGLRSNLPGKQCEAILQFVPLLQRGSQDAVLTDAALLKLGDVFQSSNNLSRFCIVHVLNKCSSHLQEARSAREFLRRTTIVLSSFDSLARGLTLRLLGACAALCAEWPECEHQVLRGLTSQDLQEVESAIAALHGLTSHSPTLAKGVLSHVLELLVGMTLPLTLKTKLAQVLRCIGGHPRQPELASRVLEGAQHILDLHPPSELAVAILKAITSLALLQPAILPTQVAVVVARVRCDPRLRVQHTGLRCLHTTARGALQALQHQELLAMSGCAATILTDVSSRVEGMDRSSQTISLALALVTALLPRLHTHTPLGGGGGGGGGGDPALPHPTSTTPSPPSGASPLPPNSAPFLLPSAVPLCAIELLRSPEPQLVRRSSLLLARLCECQQHPITQDSAWRTRVDLSSACAFALCHALQERVTTQCSGTERRLDEEVEGSIALQPLSRGAFRDITGSLASCLTRVLATCQSLSGGGGGTALRVTSCLAQALRQGRDTGMAFSGDSTFSGTAALLAGCLARSVSMLHSPEDKEAASGIVLSLLTDAVKSTLPSTSASTSTSTSNTTTGPPLGSPAAALVPLTFAALHCLPPHCNTGEDSRANNKDQAESKQEGGGDDQTHCEMQIDLLGVEKQVGIVADVLFERGCYWAAYRIGRRCACFGLYDTAQNLFERLSEEVEGENEFWWLRGLAELCSAEALLSHQRTSAPDEPDEEADEKVGTRALAAVRLLRGSTDSLASVVLTSKTSPLMPSLSSTPTPGAHFQRSYLWIRTCILDALVPVFSSLKSPARLPSPATLAHSLASLADARRHLADMRAELDDRLDALSQQCMCHLDLEVALSERCLSGLWGTSGSERSSADEIRTERGAAAVAAAGEGEGEGGQQGCLSEGVVCSDAYLQLALLEAESLEYKEEMDDGTEYSQPCTSNEEQNSFSGYHVPPLLSLARAALSPPQTVTAEAWTISLLRECLRLPHRTPPAFFRFQV